MEIRRPFTPTGQSEKKAVISSRSQNIPLYASIGEIIDNSIEWGSSEINILLKWKTKEIINSNPQPQKIIFIDNGCGMNKETLSNSLVIGFHEESVNNKKCISKFGVGCCYGFLANCKISEVYSKQKNGEWYYSFFDINSKDLDNTKTAIPPNAIKKEPPQEYIQYFSKLKSGTITIWSDFDLGFVETNKNEIPFWISRAYRKFIGDKIVTYKQEKESIIPEIIENKNKIKIYYNDELLKAYDPLYAIPFRKEDKQGSKLYTPIIIDYPKPDGSGTSKLIIQFGLSPEFWRQHSDKAKNPSAKDPINTNERHICGGGSDHPITEDSRNISILRNNREVSWLYDGYLLGRIKDIDRWWGIEILYNSSLDEIFNIEYVKYQVGLKPELRRRLKREIRSSIHHLREEISTVFETNRNNIKKEKQNDTNSNTINPIPRRDYGPIKATTQTPTDFVNRFIKTEKERQKILEELSKREFVIHDNFEKRIPKDTSLLFEYCAEGGTILMERYCNHPWFESMINIDKELKDKINSKKNITIKDIKNQYDQLRTLWEILLQSLVIVLATTKEDKVIDKILSEWGRLSLKSIESNNEILRAN